MGRIIRHDDPEMWAVNRIIGDIGIGPWNDRHSHADVLAMLDAAIAVAGEHEGVTPLDVMTVGESPSVVA
jgi:hypothetical protein